MKQISESLSHGQWHVEVPLEVHTLGEASWEVLDHDRPDEKPIHKLDVSRTLIDMGAEDSPEAIRTIQPVPSGSLAFKAPVLDTVFHPTLHAAGSHASVALLSHSPGEAMAVVVSPGFHQSDTGNSCAGRPRLPRGQNSGMGCPS